MDQSHSCAGDKKQDRLTVDKVIASVERILKAEAEEVLICEKENLHIYCLFNYDYSKSKAIKNNINDILSEIQEILKAESKKLQIYQEH